MLQYLTSVPESNIDLFEKDSYYDFIFLGCFSVAMLLNHLGYAEAGAKVEAAVAADLKSRSSDRSTSQIGDAITAALA
jgi:hypothetical protein